MIPCECWLANFQIETIIGAVIAGGMAICAAYISLRGPNAQIEAEKAHRQKVAARSLRARRARMAIYLTEIKKFCEQALADLNKYQREVEVRGPASSGLVNAVSLNLDAGSVLALTEYTEICDDDEVSDLIIFLIDESQILASRINGFNVLGGYEMKSSQLSNIVTYKLQASSIFALLEVLFQYSRGSSDSVPREIPWSNLSDIADFRFSSAAQDKAVQEAYDRRKKSGIPIYPKAVM